MSLILLENVISHIMYFDEYFLHVIIKPVRCLTPDRNIVSYYRRIARILNWTARKSVSHQGLICLTKKHIVLAQNLPGS